MLWKHFKTTYNLFILQPDSQFCDFFISLYAFLIAKSNNDFSLAYSKLMETTFFLLTLVYLGRFVVTQSLPFPTFITFKSNVA